MGETPVHDQSEDVRAVVVPREVVEHLLLDAVVQVDVGPEDGIFRPHRAGGDVAIGADDRGSTAERGSPIPIYSQHSSFVFSSLAAAGHLCDRALAGLHVGRRSPPNTPIGNRGYHRGYWTGDLRLSGSSVLTEGLSTATLRGTTEHALIQSGGGTGPMKPGNLPFVARCQFLQGIPLGDGSYVPWP